MPPKNISMDKRGPIKIDNPQKTTLKKPEKGVEGSVFGNGTLPNCYVFDQRGKSAVPKCVHFAKPQKFRADGSKYTYASH